MKKTIWRILTATVLILSLLLSLASCDLFGGNDDDDDEDDNTYEDSASISDTFYLLNGDVVDKNVWITFERSLYWHDSNNNEGNYTYNGHDDVKLYDNDDKRYASGTLVDGILELRIKGTTYVYVLESDSPNDSAHAFGTFYFYDENKGINKNKWIDIDSGSYWKDSDGNNGFYEYDSYNGDIFFYVGDYDTFALGRLGEDNLEIFSYRGSQVSYFYVLEDKSDDPFYNDTNPFEYHVNADGNTCTIGYMKNYNTAIVEIPSEIDGYKVTAIAPETFRGNKNIISVTLPSTLETIGENAFEGCSKLIEVRNLSNIDASPDNYRNNGYVSFYAFSILNSESEESHIEIVDDYVFYFENLMNDYYLMGYVGNETSLMLPKDINGYTYDIYPYAFYDNDQIKNIDISDFGVSYIGDYAFYGSSISSVYIGENVSSIGYEAFAECSMLQNVHYNAVLVEDQTYDKNIWNRAGFSSNGFVLTVGRSVTRIPSYLFYGSTDSLSYLLEINFENNSACQSIGRYAFRESDILCSLSLPHGLLIIEENAFAGCVRLDLIAIPNSVETIGKDAFQACEGVKELSIGTGVKTIERYAFNNLKSLEMIYFNAVSMNDLSYGYNSIFEYAGSKSDGIKVVIGSSATKIPATLFYDPYVSTSAAPNITTIEFEYGTSCKLIGKDSFRYCKKLSSVIFNGTVEEWNAITKGEVSQFSGYYEWWNMYTGEYTIRCTNGTIAKDGTVTKN